MAYNNFSSASVDIWDQVNDTRQSLADTVFATTSISGIEMADDYEPVVYQATRALMEANAVDELKQLQQQNHATTAYSTLNCEAKPLFPLFDAQRKKICSEQEERARLMLKDPAGFSGPAACNVAAPGGIRTNINVEPHPQNGAAPNSPHNGAFTPELSKLAAPHAKHIKKNRFLNSIRGALYDLKHWKELPPETATDTWKFITTRDDRGGYLLLLFTLVLFFIAVLIMLISGMRQKKKQGRQMMKMLQAIQNKRRVQEMQGMQQMQRRQPLQDQPQTLGGGYTPYNHGYTQHYPYRAYTHHRNSGGYMPAYGYEYPTNNTNLELLESPGSYWGQ